MLPHLGFDIQVEIIKVLTVKSLIRFRSVCKAWKSLIDSSRFIAGYNNRHDLPQHLVVKYDVGRYGEERHQVNYVSFVDDDSFPQQKFALTVPPILQAKATRIIDSSHGLLCLTNYLGMTDLDDFISETHIVVLWNPAIRKSIVVGLPDAVEWPFEFVIGFGVCPDTKDALLVKIKYIDDNYWDVVERISSIPCQVMVFTLSSGKWKTSSCTNHLPRKSIGFSSDKDQAVVGQFIYWLACDRFDVDDDEYHNVIMSFDMSTHEFREVDLPEYMAQVHESSLSISRLRESLVVVEYRHVVKRFCSVWMMEDGDSKAFTKLFTINLPNASVSKTLGFRKSGETIVETFDDYRDYDTPSGLVVYESCSEHIKDLGIRGNRFSLFVSSYKESLLLLDHDIYRGRRRIIMPISRSTLA